MGTQAIPTGLISQRRKTSMVQFHPVLLLMWTEAPDRRGCSFEHSDGRIIEVYEASGNDWVADVLHEYGCTRLCIAESQSDAMHAAAKHMR